MPVENVKLKLRMVGIDPASIPGNEDDAVLSMIYQQQHTKLRDILHRNVVPPSLLDIVEDWTVGTIGMMLITSGSQAAGTYVKGVRMGDTMTQWGFSQGAMTNRDTFTKLLDKQWDRLGQFRALNKPQPLEE